MGAPQGNDFWKIRATHGRDALFTDPNLLLEAANEYFQWVNDNPWYKKEAIKSGDSAGKVIDIETARPYTLIGLCLYLGVNELYFRDFKKSEIYKTHKDFSQVITRIEEIIRTNKYEGGMTGAFNANIVMRDLGMIDKSEQATEITVKKVGFSTE